MQHDDPRQVIESGQAVLGIELGSTRIKAVLIDRQHQPIASGSYAWENRYEHGVWTYHLSDVWSGLQASYRALSDEVRRRYNVPIRTLGAIGISAMMHGYLAFDAAGELLVPFRTWRNTITAQAAQALSDLFQFNIPQRWSIAHLYQAMRNGEAHVRQIDFLTTLAGYVHWQLTGERVLGIGDASGMFPIDSATNQYDQRMLALFNAELQAAQLPWRLEQILPAALPAGQPAGVLSEAGARLLDPSGQLQPGIPLCPPEGDAGTGMVATNSVAPRTGNVSAGTSVFAMIVLERPLAQVYPEIDIVTTPSGVPVAMVHSNNCTSDLNAWVGLFGEFARLINAPIDEAQLFERLYTQALAGDADAGGLLAYNYHSGEHITHMEQGRPLFVRTPDSRLTLANFMRAHLFAALGALRIGCEILFEREHVRVERVYGHGGFFKTQQVGQRIMAAALRVPIAVLETAGEGGAWGSALLAAYLLHKDAHESLEHYLANRVFAAYQATTLAPDPRDVQGFAAFMQRYKRGLVIERTAIDALPTAS
ncbi:xylulokinase [Kallotenue papyrolyticum]|uniref:xylulokinase n=1 Tax=Kallotenue papyrolyticum TaxID=1325125 RepID=UPI0004706CFE|nr:FGGY-family carbohydrate kinase [Kallotenue papyrolyticum]